MSFGPPPPGYVRIRGEAVPGWKPEDMLPGARNARSGLAWSPLGPRPILSEYWSGNDDASGRVVSIAPHPTDPDIVYLASASGGIWKTTDGGDLWIPLTDELSSLNHGCVALDPSNPDTVYVGTGEYPTNTNGDGLFRSFDGGITWTRIATTGQVGTRCSRIIVDPTDPDIIHVTGNSGYIRSTDGGLSWSTMLFGSASDLALNPLNPSILYVGRRGDGVYQSTDGGTSLVRLGGGLPSSNVARILVSIAASNPDIVYTAIVDNGSHLRGLYKTTDGGAIWTLMGNTPDFPYPQGWYDVFLGVDPTDEDTLFAGGVFPSYAVAGVIRSTDGGANWTDISVDPFGGQLHPDQHAVAFGPTGALWVGNDGGIWRSDNGGQSWQNKNATLTLTQNYNIALHPTDPDLMMGGTQDNGTVGRDFGTDDWPQIIGGDGGFLAYDSDSPTRRYTTYVRLSVYRFVGGGAQNITGPWDSDSVAFIAPLVMDPNDPHILLGGTNRIWRTTNAHTGANWTAISSSIVSSGGVMNAIAVATGDSDIIYTGSSGGTVYVTTDGSSWVNRSAGLPGGGQISDISIDPENPATAYVAFHRTSGTRVVRTDDFGENWDSVTGNMPSGISARALAVDWRMSPPGLYAGSGVGVYSSNDGGVSWEKDGTDLPNVNIGDLVIDPVQDTITAGTYGRGVWRAQLPVNVATTAKLPPFPDSAKKNRYISFAPSNDDRVVAFSVEWEETPGAPVLLGWVGEPGVGVGGSEGDDISRIVAEPVYRVWPEAVVHVSDCGIIPVSTYLVSTTAGALDFTPPLTIETIDEPSPKLWGDAVGELIGTVWQPPNGVTNITDAVAAILKFQNTGAIPPLSWVDIHPEVPNNIVNFDDVFYFVLAFKGDLYPFADPLSCP